MVLTRKWAEFQTSPAPRAGSRIYVSVNSRGIIVLNKRAHASLGKPEAVNLLYDIDNLTIGLRPCSLIMPNAFPICQRGNRNHIIWALSFLKAHQIHPTGTIRFLLPQMENGVLTLDLNYTARTTQSPRTGWRKKRRSLTPPYRGS